MILLLLRRSSPRARVIAGAILTAFGAAMIARTIAGSTGFPVHGIIVTVIGANLLAHGLTTRRRIRAAR
ncbi:MAG TPA: hypothetical protein VMU95_11230 [Trebonia sp.]|nr:hypothetical protein [Trebonia sp.]